MKEILQDLEAAELLLRQRPEMVIQARIHIDSAISKLLEQQKPDDATSLSWLTDVKTYQRSLFELSASELLLVIRNIQTVVSEVEQKNKRRSLLLMNILGSLLFGYWILSLGFRTGNIFLWGMKGPKGISVLSSDQSWGHLQFNRSVTERALKIKGVIYPEGLGTHADSNIRIGIDPAKRFLSGGCGVDQNGGNAKSSIRCSVQTLEGEELWESDRLTVESSPSFFKIAISTHSQILLVVEDDGDGKEYDHADWIALRVR